MNFDKDKSCVESLLFVSGEPLKISIIAKLIDKKEEEVKSICDDISEDYKKNNRGIGLVFKEDLVQMVSNKENAKNIEAFLKMDIEGELSRSALETISIVAYRGPITRSDIEDVRGVNCSFTLRQLSIRGLVEKVDNPNDSRSYLYKISLDFLKHMGLEKVEDLPMYEDLRKKELISEKIVEDSASGDKNFD